MAVKHLAPSSRSRATELARSGFARIGLYELGHGAKNHGVHLCDTRHARQNADDTARLPAGFSGVRLCDTSLHPSNMVDTDLCQQLMPGTRTHARQNSNLTLPGPLDFVQKVVVLLLPRVLHRFGVPTGGDAELGATRRMTPHRPRRYTLHVVLLAL